MRKAMDAASSAFTCASCAGETPGSAASAQWKLQIGARRPCGLPRPFPFSCHHDPGSVSARQSNETIGDTLSATPQVNSGTRFRSQVGHAAYASNASTPPMMVFAPRAAITSFGATR